MARRYQKTYREYRGRRSGGGSIVLKVIVALLAVLLIGGVLFTVFLGKYVEYTDEGVRVDLPWLRKEEPEEPAYSDALVVVTPEPAPTPEPTPEPILPLNALEVTAAQIADGTAVQMAAQAGSNCIVVEMKDAYGKLNWAAETTPVQGVVNAVGGAAGEEIARLARQEELYLVARVNCFRDQALASAGMGGPMQTIGGKVWYDRYGLRWVSPVSQQVCEYLTALCVELAELGFDEVLLECAGFPHLGEVHVLGDHGLRPEDLSAPVGAFLDRVEQALAGTETKLSLLVNEAMVAGTDSASGINTTLLARYAHRVWVKPPVEEGVDYTALLEQAGMDRAGERLVLIGAADGQDSRAAMSGLVS